MTQPPNIQELIRLYGEARDATQELSFCFSKLPMHFKACASDLQRGKPISVDNIAYQGALLKTRATTALQAIGALHEQAAATFPEQQDEEAA